VGQHPGGSCRLQVAKRCGYLLRCCRRERQRGRANGKHPSMIRRISWASVIPRVTRIVDATVNERQAAIWPRVTKPAGIKCVTVVEWSTQMHKGPRWRKLDVGYFVGGEGTAKKLFTTIKDLRKVMASR
jgi:hypothetical protein